MIDNIDLSKWRDGDIKDNAECVPQNNFRAIVSGGSGSGKTICVVNMILKYLTFDRIYIFGPSIEQPAYKMLQETFGKIDEERAEIVSVFNENRSNKKKGIRMKMPPRILTMAENLDSFDLDKVDKSLQNLVILDDLVLAKQNPMINLYVRGRHRNCSVMYLTQCFYGCPKIIRTNATCVLLFNPTTKRELQQLYRDIGAGIDQKQFISTVLEALKERFSFVKIDTAQGDLAKRYTAGLNKSLFNQASLH